MGWDAESLLRPLKFRDESGLITDLIYTQTMKIPFLAKLGGIPSDFDMRIRSRRMARAARGELGLTPWDLQTGEVVARIAS